MSERKSMVDWLKEHRPIDGSCADWTEAAYEAARRIDALEKRIDNAVASICVEQGCTNRLGIRVLALEEQRDNEAAMVNYCYPKPEGVYVKPGGRVKWKGEMVVVAENCPNSAWLYVWTWTLGEPTIRVAQRKDLTVDGKPVLGLEGER
jgi:hypothetical protein